MNYTTWIKSIELHIQLSVTQCLIVCVICHILIFVKSCVECDILKCMIPMTATVHYLAHSSFINLRFTLLIVHAYWWSFEISSIELLERIENFTFNPYCDISWALQCCLYVRHFTTIFIPFFSFFSNMTKIITSLQNGEY